METIGTWKNGKIKATFSDHLGLAVWYGIQLAGAHMSVERAMELVNHLADEIVWSEGD